MNTKREHDVLPCRPLTNGTGDILGIRGTGSSEIARRPRRTPTQSITIPFSPSPPLGPCSIRTPRREMSSAVVLAASANLNMPGRTKKIDELDHHPEILTFQELGWKVKADASNSRQHRCWPRRG